tara:strand:+ start:164 stop:352 length:189 start_codon:yes stop_codon:yes gene_type:complete
LQTLRRRLADIQSKVPPKPNPEAETAFRELLAYLDTLAHRKQTGDPTVQAEIEAVGKMMIAQ